MLLAPKREELAEKIRARALAVGVGIVPPERIDALGIAPAGRLAMAEALAALTPVPEYALIDAFTLPEVDIPHHGIIDGDALSISIAAASIVAKVHRDHIMTHVRRPLSGVRLCSPQGLLAPREHLEALARHGPCPIHRRSFAPVRDCLVGGGA